jgi:hypothetical protein
LQAADGVITTHLVKIHVAIALVDGNRNTIWAICQEFLQPDDGLS